MNQIYYKYNTLFNNDKVISYTILNTFQLNFYGNLISKVTSQGIVNPLEQKRFQKKKENENLRNIQSYIKQTKQRRKVSGDKYVLYQNPVNNDLINNHIQFSARNLRKRANTESGIGDLIYQRKSNRNQSLLQRKNKRFGNFHH